MSRIEIPAELAAEADQHAERFRSAIRLGDYVLVLGQENPQGGFHVGMVGAADRLTMRGLEVVVPNIGRARARAWAPIGSVDDPASPRPADGDRVLALRVRDSGLACVMDVDNPRGPEGGVLAINETGIWELYRWAILPPAHAPTEPASDLEREADAPTVIGAGEAVTPQESEGPTQDEVAAVLGAYEAGYRVGFEAAQRQKIHSRAALRRLAEMADQLSPHDVRRLAREGLSLP